MNVHTKLVSRIYPELTFAEATMLKELLKVRPSGDLPVEEFRQDFLNKLSDAMNILPIHPPTDGAPD